METDQNIFSWAEAWHSNYMENESKGWLAALLTCTGFMYSGAIAAIVLMFVYYTGEWTGQCKLHEFFITFNMLLCVVLTVTSVLPKVNILTFKLHQNIFVL